MLLNPRENVSAAETPLARNLSASRYLSNFCVFVSKFNCMRAFRVCFLRGVFGVPKRFYGVKVMTRELPFVVTCMSRSCFRKSLTLLWNLRGMCNDMRSYSYTCLLRRYRFLETLHWILTISLSLHGKNMFLSLGS